MELIDLLPIVDWVSTENDIRDRSGFSVSVFNTSGVRITDNLKWSNRLCPEIKANPKGQSFICATAHMNLANMAKKTREPVVEECDAGLIKMVVPIVVDGELIGVVGACGMLFDQGEVDTFLINKITEMEESVIERLSQGIGAISSEKASELIEHIQQRLEEIIGRFKPGHK